MSPHHHLVVVLALASLASLGEAFLPTQTSVANAQHRSRAPLGSLAMAAPAEGLHGTGSRFLPIQQLQNDDYFPRTIAIAGEYPGVTAAEILGLKSAAAPEVGQWQYDFTDPQGPQMGTVALPGGPVISQLEDPIVLITTSDVVGISLPQDDVAEVLLIVDKDQTEFDPSKFYAWADSSGVVSLRWYKEMPALTILGRVMMVAIPFLPSMQKKKTGWMEADDDFA